jgi:ABC-type spermidine/putrescine transport system permease subunit I
MILTCTVPSISLSLIYTLAVGGINGLSVLIFLPTAAIFIVVSLLGGAIGGVIGEKQKRDTNEPV